MHRTAFLILTALIEVGTGLLLIFLPALPNALLLGLGQAAPETTFVGRIAGAALLALGVTSWLARNDRSDTQRGVLIGVLTYDGAASVLLAHGGLALGLTIVALWPAVILHAALGVWAVLCLCVGWQGE